MNGLNQISFSLGVEVAKQWVLGASSDSEGRLGAGEIFTILASSERFKLFSLSSMHLV